MVVTDGKVRSVEGIIKIFDEFATVLELTISMQKSTISMQKSTMYLAGITYNARQDMETQFPFETGQLPNRYLGLPLLTKRMSSSDYLPLLEQIRKRISTWTTRFLSFAGRLQLIRSVLTSISNFWLSAFRLPNECIREIEKLCSAFLWSGPELNPRKAKISWDIVCKRKDEGGLGLRPLKEYNVVCCLKLIWRILSSTSSMWVQWIRHNVIRKEVFWSVKTTTSLGSWMWKKFLKYRGLAKDFFEKEIGNGKSTSFWYDRWSSLGCLMDITGVRGVIDMGIPSTETVEYAWSHRRRRCHRAEILGKIEEHLEGEKHKSIPRKEDVALWKPDQDTFIPRFVANKTWLLIRKTHNRVDWHKGVWFSHSTPKFAFLTWLAIHNRLATGDHMLSWNVGANPSCVLCQEPIETKSHLFFSCNYAKQVWTKLCMGLLDSRFSVDWDTLLNVIKDTSMDKTKGFIIRYVFQCTLYSIWKERNSRKHGETPIPAQKLIKTIDKQVRNRLLSIRALGDSKYDVGLQLWFATRR